MNQCEVSELIYETCKTYLVTQGKFILLLELFIGAVMVLYFGVLRAAEFTPLKTAIIVLFSLVGIAGSYGVAWFGIRINTYANSRCAFASLAGKPYPIYAIPLQAGISIGTLLICVELAIMLCICTPRTRRPGRRLTIGSIPKGTPHPLHSPAIGVEHDHTAVPIAIGDKGFIGFRVDKNVGGSVDVLRVGVALALAARPKLLDELSLNRELQQHVVADAAATDPDDVPMVDENAVFCDGPVVSRRVAAPGIDKFSLGVELENRRRHSTFQVLRHRSGTVQYPDVIAPVDRDRRDDTHHPIIGKSRPVGVDLKHRHCR